MSEKIFKSSDQPLAPVYSCLALTNPLRVFDSTQCANNNDCIDCSFGNELELLDGEVCEYPPSNSKKRKLSSAKKISKSVIEVACQTSGWKFMSEIGVIEQSKTLESNIPISTFDKLSEASIFLKSVRIILEASPQSDIVTTFNNVIYNLDNSEMIMKNNDKSCILCGELFENVSFKYHVATNCSVFEQCFQKMIIGRNEAYATVDKTNILTNKDEVKDTFKNEYVFHNSPETMRQLCFFCGEYGGDKSLSEPEMHVFKKHLFTDCKVFSCFLKFLSHPDIVSMTQKIGTSWTFLYYHIYLVYFSMEFTNPPSDLQFIREEKAYLIIRTLENIAKSITVRQTCCPLCYSSISSNPVLIHHLTFGLCPVLLLFYEEMKTHTQQVWTSIKYELAHQKVGCMYQYMMSFQNPIKPILLQQNVLSENLCSRLIENAFYYKSIDSNFSLQSHKMPKDSEVAQKIEDRQQKWAVMVLRELITDAECPFCKTVFNTERNLIKHVMYASCKSLRQVWNMINSLIEYCDWSVLRHQSFMTRHTAYVLRECFVGGLFSINLSCDNLSEFISIVVDNFLASNITDDQRKMLFESKAENMLSGPGEPIFDMFYEWARKITKRKNVTSCLLCDAELDSYNSLLDHIAMGICPYLKKILSIIDEILKYNQLNVQCNIPQGINICQNRSLTFDMIHHIRKIIFIHKASNQNSATFFDDVTFEKFLINSPTLFQKHHKFISFLVTDNSTVCSYCYLDLKTSAKLRVHLLYFKCCTFKFLIKLIKNEWDTCQAGKVPSERLVELISYYTRLFELDPNINISSSYLKKFFFADKSNKPMLENIRKINLWAQDMYVYDKESSLKVCRACKLAAENIERHVWLEDPRETFCPEIRAYLDFHRKMVCKKDGKAEIKASFTITDLFDLKRYIQYHIVEVNENTDGSRTAKCEMIYPQNYDLLRVITEPLKSIPDVKFDASTIKEFYSKSKKFTRHELAFAEQFLSDNACMLCGLKVSCHKRGLSHISSFECPVVQELAGKANDNYYDSRDSKKTEVLSGYKRTVAYCRDLYPKLMEGNLLVIMEAINPECYSKLSNVITNKLPKSNPYQCVLCDDNLLSRDEIYTHYRTLSCLGLRECIGSIPYTTMTTENLLVKVIYDIFKRCYCRYGTRGTAAFKAFVSDKNSTANSFDFWCKRYCDYLVPLCPFCDDALNSTYSIHLHPKRCSKLKEINLEIFTSDRGDESVFLKQQGLGSCKISGK